MTPTAVTPAARTRRHDRAATAAPTRTQMPPRTTSPRKAPPRPSSPHPSTPRNGGHRRLVPRSTTPRTPRRVSGPVPGDAGLRARRQVAPASPRPRLTARSLAYVRALPDHSLLDRIVRGRTWIPLLGVLLVGIVAMQVEVLKLNAGVGRSLQRGAALQSQNELLRANVARLSDDQRIESMAAHLGMVMAAPAAVRFLAGDASAGVGRAVANIHLPNATAFSAQLAAAQTSSSSGA